jgi:hypothetical protein
MLIRDLPWKPREDAHYFDCAYIALSRNAFQLYIERRIKNSERIGEHGLYINYREPPIGIRLSPGYRYYKAADEFEAQMMLDHILQTYAPEKMSD